MFPTVRHISISIQWYWGKSPLKKWFILCTRLIFSACWVSSRKVATKMNMAGVSSCVVVSAGICLALGTMIVQCLHFILAGQWRAHIVFFWQWWWFNSWHFQALHQQGYSCSDVSYIILFYQYKHIILSAVPRVWLHLIQSHSNYKIPPYPDNFFVTSLSGLFWKSPCFKITMLRCLKERK